MYKVYGDIFSGNCYKVKLLMALLDIAHEWIHVDILAGESRGPEFRAMNPVGKIPTLELPGGEFMSESNAILASKPLVPSSLSPNSCTENVQFAPTPGSSSASEMWRKMHS